MTGSSAALCSPSQRWYMFSICREELFLGPEKTRRLSARTQRCGLRKSPRSQFEYKAGKVPDTDYASLKTSLQDEAATILAEISRLEQNLRRSSPENKALKGTQNLKSPSPVIQRKAGIHARARRSSRVSVAASQTLTGTVKKPPRANRPRETKSSCSSSVKAWKKPAAPRRMPRANSVSSSTTRRLPI